MITRLIVSVPGDVDESGYWVHMLDDKFLGYEITKIISANNLVSLHGVLPDGEVEKLLRSYNANFVICMDYI